MIRKLLLVPIDSICPWDRGHTPETLFEKHHREGIEFCKQLISEGRLILPILVNDFDKDPVKERSGQWFLSTVLGIKVHNFRFQREDGFKRYMAFKELGFRNILVIYDPYARKGGQEGQPLIVNERYISKLLGI